MAFVDLNFNPRERQLREFGLICCVALPLVTWLLHGRPLGSSWGTVHTFRISVAAAIGLLAAATALKRPGLLKWIFVGASVATFPIGIVVGEVVMLLVYLIAFVPIALWFRFVGRDALQLKIDRDAESYWSDKEPARGPGSYYRQS